MKVLEEAERAAKIKNKEKLIDDLMFGHEDASKILAQHREKVSSAEDCSDSLTSAANRLIGEVVQSRRRPLLGPSPG